MKTPSRSISSLQARDFFDDALLKLNILERNPQVPFPLHSHDFAELVIVLSGSGVHFTEGADYRVQTGDVFVIESGYSHGYRDISDLRLYNVIFDPAILNSLFVDINTMPGYHAVFKLEPRLRAEHAFASRLRLNQEQLRHARNLIVRMRTELAHITEGNGGRALAAAGLIELVVFLSRLYAQSPDAQSPDAQSQAAGMGEIMQMADVLAFLESRLDRPVAVDDLAAVANMSPSTLNRSFHRTVGCSPVDYHLKLRIDRAADLLAGSRLSITGIAEMTGFFDSNYFSRQFRRRRGISPRDYRKQHRLQP
jgi:AraC-like DNA-binding protein